MPLLQSTDQMGEIVTFQFPPQRIVSLVPSQSELLFFLGLENEVAGITKFCIHPASWLQKKTKIGGTKKFDFDVIASLNPDLIIGNKEENYPEGIRILKEKYPVWMSDIYGLDDALEMIQKIGVLTGKEEQAYTLTKSIRISFLEFLKPPAKRVLYLIWHKPWMAAGRETFIHDILTRIGLVNAISKGRYPEIEIQEIAALDPEIVLLSSEPFPFREKHIEELRKVLPRSRFLLVDGEMFSWYGNRLLYACDYFRTLSI